MKKVRITHNFINKLIECDQILTFSYFIKLKYLYSNSTIYDFSIRKSARLINVSPNCIKYHLSIMKKMGVIKVVKNKRGKNNLTFCSISKISKMYGVSHNTRCGSILFHKLDNIQTIKTRLYSKVLINNINKQKHTIKSKSNSIMRKKDQLKKIKDEKISSSLSRSIESERINFDTFICCETIGNMFLKTKMTGYNQLLKMTKLGILSAKRKCIPILKCNKEEFNRLYNFGNLTKGKYYYNYTNSCIMKNVGFSINIS